MKHKIKRIEKAKSYNPRMGAEAVCKILSDIYPPEAVIELHKSDNKQMTLATFLQYIRDQAMFDSILGTSKLEYDFIVLDSAVLNYTQVTNGRLTASLWKQDRKPINGKGGENK